MRLHPGILRPAQARVLQRLGPQLLRRSFYLAGGTAAALQLGHRRSVDLDWFTAEPLPDPLRLAREIQESGVSLVVTGVERGTLHATVSGVRVTLLEYRYPLLQPFTRWEERSVSLASLADIACMKLAAVAQCGSKRDFVDVYAIARRFSLARMLSFYRRKYGIRDAGHVLYALTYFDDADGERMPDMLRPWRWDAIKAVILRKVAELARE